MHVAKEGTGLMWLNHSKLDPHTFIEGKSSHQENIVHKCMSSRCRVCKISYHSAVNIMYMYNVMTTRYELSQNRDMKKQLLSLTGLRSKQLGCFKMCSLSAALSTAFSYFGQGS